MMTDGEKDGSMPMGASKPGKIKSALVEEMPEDEDMSASPEEVDAFKVFKSAASPEEGAAALKAFIQLCGGY